MPAIIHRLLIAAPAATVYIALTTANGLSAWWTPGVGVLGTVARFPFGPGYHKDMEITLLETNKRAVWKCVNGANEWIGTTLSFNLTEMKNGLLGSYPEMQGQAEQLTNADTVTLLDFTHSGWRARTPMFAECNYTWALFLKSLKTYCETGTGSPWPNQHR